MQSASGDEAGTPMGFMSQTNMAKVRVQAATGKVMAEGSKTVRHISLNRQLGEKQFKIIEKQARKKR